MTAVSGSWPAPADPRCLGKTASVGGRIESNLGKRPALSGGPGRRAGSCRASPAPRKVKTCQSLSPRF